MKQLLLLVLTIGYALSLHGQTSPFPKTPRVKMVLVKQDCKSCNPSTLNITTSKYLFDKDGNNIIWYSMSEGKPSGKMTYNYQNGILISYQNNSTWVSTSAEGDFGMTWDSTLLTNEETYLYTNGLLSNTHGIDGDSKRASFDIQYTYNTEGKVLTEETKCYPNPDFIGSFEPGTDKLKDDPDALKFTTFKKVYQYAANSIVISYYKDGIQTGLEKIETDNKGNKVKGILNDMKGNLQARVSHKYNNKGQLIEQIASRQGINGFGNATSDSMVFEKEIMSYDSNGHLISKKQYYHGQVYIEERYQYIP